MKHLSEEEIVEHYFADPTSKIFRNAQRHLDGCGECGTESAQLADDMNALREMDSEVLSATYGEEVWSRLKDTLPQIEVEHRAARRFTWWQGLSYAGACAVVVLGAFQIGRMWEHRQHPITPAAKAPPPASAERQVVVVVLGDHLDRSERLLVELKHANGEDAEVVTPLRDEARGLLAANREFLQDAGKGDDEALKEALDHLDHLLSHVANEPGGLNAEGIVRLQKEMKVDGLLFQVRVLRSRMPNSDRTVRVPAKGGTA